MQAWTDMQYAKYCSMQNTADTDACTDLRHACEQIDFPELRSGFKRMDTDPPIDFKLEDYNEQVVKRGLAMTNRQLDYTHFTNYINVGLKEVLTCAIQK
jgi:hypothetical protein